jgi:hypothetical protein
MNSNTNNDNNNIDNNNTNNIDVNNNNNNNNGNGNGNDNNNDDEDNNNNNEDTDNNSDADEDEDESSSDMGIDVDPNLFNNNSGVTQPSKITSATAQDYVQELSSAKFKELGQVMELQCEANKKTAKAFKKYSKHKRNELKVTLKDLQRSVHNIERNMANIDEKTNRSLFLSTICYNCQVRSMGLAMPVPFLNGVSPIDVGLPLLQNRRDISNLTREQVRQYLVGYGVNFLSHATTESLREILFNTLGYE